MPNTQLESKPESRIINYLHMSPFDYEWLLNKFHPSFHDKLRQYTGQELFYCYKLCTFQPKDRKNIKHSEVFFLAMQAKQMAWLRGKVDPKTIGKTRVDSVTGQTVELKPTPLVANGIAAKAWDKIGSRWNRDFEEVIELDVA